MKRVPAKWLALLVPALLLSLQAAARQRVVLQLQHFVNGRKLLLDSSVYKNALGQAYTVSRLRYYLGKIELIRADGSSYRCRNYFLVDEDAPASREITLDSVDEGRYVQLRF